MRRFQSELANLPKSFADNPQAHLLSLCTAFIQDVDTYTNGKPAYPPTQPTFLRDCLEYYRDLEKDIKYTRPQFEIMPTATTSREGTKDGIDTGLL